MNTCVLIFGHDRYSSVWPIMANSIKKYWADNSFPVYLTSNFKDAPKGIYTLKMYEDKGWGYTCRQAVSFLSAFYDYVIILCEDYWLTKEWKTFEIKSFIELMGDYSLNHIRLIPSSEQGEWFIYDSYDRRLNHFNREAQYKTSLNVGIWRIMALYDLVVTTETIWDFETQAGKRIKPEDEAKFLSVNEWKYVHYVHPDDPEFNWSGGAIEAGEYKKAAYEYAEKEGISLCPL